MKSHLSIQKLYIPDIVFEKLDVPAPVALPAPRAVEDSLVKLALEIYGTHAEDVRRLLR